MFSPPQQLLESLEGLYVGGEDGVYIFDAKTGDNVSTFTLDAGVQDAITVNEEGILYLGDIQVQSTFYAIDVETKEELWRFQSQGRYSTKPTISGDMTVFGSEDYYVYALNRHSGVELWRFKTKNKIRTSPLVSGEKGKGVLLVVVCRMARYSCLEKITDVNIPAVHQAFKRIKIWET